ncbi:MAG: ribonuclease HII [Spirochaetes bacterium]|nr:ribonuclease HII [Spirochaetota bacterium]
MHNAPNFTIERDLLAKGKKIIAGADEAGRGALAGPLAVGLVIFPDHVIHHPPRELIETVRDSKLLTPQQRIEACKIIKKHARFFDVCVINHREIDRLNINGATEYALQKLVSRAKIFPDVVIFDGRFAFDVGCDFASIVNGDALCISIAAASIFAKVRRDRIMEKLDACYPEYGFARHKGYATVAHKKKIFENGPCPIHRRSYEPIKTICSTKNPHWKMQ